MFFILPNISLLHEIENEGVDSFFDEKNEDIDSFFDENKSRIARSHLFVNGDHMVIFFNCICSYSLVKLTLFDFI